VRADFPYARALVAAAPLSELARAVARRARRLPSVDIVIDDEARRLAADALGRAPHLFSPVPLAEPYRVLFPDGVARLRRRAEDILAHRIELFGHTYQLGRAIDWLADPCSCARFDGDGDPRELLERLVTASDAPERIERDPKRVWELGRGAHLLELGAAGRVCPDLEASAREEIAAQLDSFLVQVRPGRGFAYASPLEVGLRAIHWLAAIEFAGGARRFPRPLVERVAGALLFDLSWLWAHREDRGVAPANHLLGDLVAVWVLALALDGAPGARLLIRPVREALEREAARQVGPDGAHFEASTGYHCFALELLVVAHLAARTAGVELEVDGPLRRMFGYLRGVLAPDGTHPGFGDSDDGRVLPVVPREPRSAAHLLPVGVVLFQDPTLRPPQLRFSEEALWIGGPTGHRLWQALEASPHPSAVSFPSGGVHVLRDHGTYVALRAGSYGQNGVGGHAHNDQLSVVVHVSGRPLIADAGTGCYTRDRLLRDRLRGTGAHSTVILDGAEQSPILDGRLFALPDRASVPGVIVEDVGAWARLEASHQGYRRLPARATHRRAVTLHREGGLLLIEDHLDGRGEVAVDVRFLAVEPASAGARAATLERLARLARLLGPVDLARVIELGERAALVPLGGAPLQPRVEPGLISPRWQELAPATLVSFSGRLRLPASVRHALLFLDRR
jgi:hypothetical protein